MLQTRRYRRGLALYRQGRYAEAIRQLSPLCGAEGMPGRVARFYLANSHRQVGIQALANGRFDQAEQHLRAAVDYLGQANDLAGYLACIYAGRGRYGDCASEMEKVAKLQRDNPQAWRKLSLAQWRRGNRALAYMALHEALRKLGDNCELHLQMGLFHAAEQQYDQARAALTRAIEADCTRAEAHYYLGLVVAAQGEPAAAVESLQRAFELRPDDLLLAYQLALAARAATESGLAVSLRLPDPVVRPGECHMRQLARYVCHEGDFVDAFVMLPASDADQELFGLLEGVLRIAINDHPGYADLHYHHSRVLQRLNRIAEAIEAAGKAITINPRYVTALVHLGRLCAEAGQAAQAVAFLNRAIASGGKWADVHCLIGQLLAKLGQRDKAKMHLRRALDVNAKYDLAAEELTALAA